MSLQLQVLQVLHHRLKKVSVAVVPDGSLNRPLANRREVGDAGIDLSRRPGVERHRGRDVGVP
jgi:hypothetical protein